MAEDDDDNLAEFGGDVGKLLGKTAGRNWRLITAFLGSIAGGYLAYLAAEVTGSLKSNPRTAWGFVAAATVAFALYVRRRVGPSKAIRQELKRLREQNAQLDEGKKFLENLPPLVTVDLHDARVMLDRKNPIENVGGYFSEYLRVEIVVVSDRAVTLPNDPSQFAISLRPQNDKDPKRSKDLKPVYLRVHNADFKFLEPLFGATMPRGERTFRAKIYPHPEVRIDVEHLFAITQQGTGVAVALEWNPYRPGASFTPLTYEMLPTT